MAVHAQYPSTVLLLNRNEPDRSPDKAPIERRQAIFFSDGTGGDGTRKRAKEGTDMPLAQQLLYHDYVNLLCFQPPPPPQLVSTGLCLASDLPCPDVGLEAEMAKLLDSQGEQLRRTLAEGSRRFIRTAANAAAGRVREKDEELERAVKRKAELEERLARLAGDSAAWQARATAQEAAVVALREQLRQAESLAGDDAGSSFVDLPRFPVCRHCAASPAVVLLLPCRHLCLCLACDSTATACPVCCCVRSTGVEIYLP